MKLTLLAVLALSVTGLGLAGCEGDASAPTRPRMKAVAPDDKTHQNAEKRALEAPGRDLPTAGKEFPGQTMATPAAGASVVTLTSYHKEKGEPSRVMPWLAETPGTTPATGTTVVPGLPWTIDHSWGECLPLKDYNHRDWSDTKTTYMTAEVKGNPTLYDNPVPFAAPKVKTEAQRDAVKTVIDVPWFYCNTLATPVLVFWQSPWAQVTNSRLGSDPLYFGYLPKTGAIVPSPKPGEFIFEYPEPKK